MVAPVRHHCHVAKRLVIDLRHVSHTDRLASLNQAVQIKPRVATESGPDAVREVEAECLDEQYQRHPLVVRQARRSTLSRTESHVGGYVGVERQEIRVADPTVTAAHHHKPQRLYSADNVHDTLVN